MLAFNLKQDLFIDTSEQEFNCDEFIILTYCSKSESFVLTLFEDNTDLCLHNENDKHDETAIKLFKQKDKNFKMHLDFFKNEVTLF